MATKARAGGGGGVAPGADCAAPYGGLRGWQRRQVGQIEAGFAAREERPWARAVPRAVPEHAIGRGAQRRLAAGVGGAASHWPSRSVAHTPAADL